MSSRRHHGTTGRSGTSNKIETPPDSDSDHHQFMGISSRRRDDGGTKPSSYERTYSSRHVDHSEYLTSSAATSSRLKTSRDRPPPDAIPSAQYPTMQVQTPTSVSFVSASHHSSSRSRAQEPRAEAHDLRRYLKRRTDKHSPPASDDKLRVEDKSSRPSHKSRSSGVTAPVQAPSSTQMYWIPPVQTQDPVASSGQHKDRERDRDKERSKEKDREKRERERAKDPEKEQERERRREREREKEREKERHKEERDRDRAREKERERERRGTHKDESREKDNRRKEERRLAEHASLHPSQVPKVPSSSGHRHSEERAASTSNTRLPTQMVPEPTSIQPTVPPPLVGSSQSRGMLPQSLDAQRLAVMTDSRREPMSPPPSARLHRTDREKLVKHASRRERPSTQQNESGMSSSEQEHSGREYRSATAERRHVSKDQNDGHPSGASGSETDRTLSKERPRLGRTHGHASSKNRPIAAESALRHPIAQSAAQSYPAAPYQDANVTQQSKDPLHTLRHVQARDSPSQRSRQIDSRQQAGTTSAYAPPTAQPTVGFATFPRSAHQIVSIRAGQGPPDTQVPLKTSRSRAALPHEPSGTQLRAATNPPQSSNRPTHISHPYDGLGQQYAPQYGSDPPPRPPSAAPIPIPPVGAVSPMSRQPQLQQSKMQDLLPHAQPVAGQGPAPVNPSANRADFNMRRSPPIANPLPLNSTATVAATGNGWQYGSFPQSSLEGATRPRSPVVQHNTRSIAQDISSRFPVNEDYAIPTANRESVHGIATTVDTARSALHNTLYGAGFPNTIPGMRSTSTPPKQLLLYPSSSDNMSQTHQVALTTIPKNTSANEYQYMYNSSAHASQDTVLVNTNSVPHTSRDPRQNEMHRTHHTTPGVVTGSSSTPPQSVQIAASPSQSQLPPPNTATPRQATSSRLPSHRKGSNETIKQSPASKSSPAYPPAQPLTHRPSLINLPSHDTSRSETNNAPHPSNTPSGYPELARYRSPPPTIYPFTQASTQPPATIQPQVHNMQPVSRPSAAAPQMSLHNIDNLIGTERTYPTPLPQEPPQFSFPSQSNVYRTTDTFASDFGIRDTEPVPTTPTPVSGQRAPTRSAPSPVPTITARQHYGITSPVLKAAAILPSQSVQPTRSSTYPIPTPSAARPAVPHSRTISDPHNSKFGRTGDTGYFATSSSKAQHASASGYVPSNQDRNSMLTPSSLGPAPLKVQPSHAPALPSPASQMSKTSSKEKDRDKEQHKRSGFFGLFRSRSSPPKRTEVRGPPPVAVKEHARQRTSSQPKAGSFIPETRVEILASSKAGSLTPQSRTETFTAQAKADLYKSPLTLPRIAAPIAVKGQIPAPVAVSIPVNAPVVPPVRPSGRKSPASKMFTPFRLLSKKHRTVSAASVEALDGTAGTVITGADSTRSSTAGRISPPLRDPWEATREWRNNEEDEWRTRGTLRRRRPGVTFEVDEDAVQYNGPPRRMPHR